MTLLPSSCPAKSVRKLLPCFHTSVGILPFQYLDCFRLHRPPLRVLVSQRSSWKPSLPLTASAPAAALGESAVSRPLRALHASIATLPVGRLLSASVPRDQRGRIAQRYDMTSLNVNRIPTRQQPLHEEKTVVSGAQAGAGHGGNDGWGLWQTTARSEGRGGRL